MEKWRRTTALPFWNDLSSELQREMLDAMTIKSFSETKQIDLQRLTGAGADALWVILEGNISIVIESIDGKNCRLLRMREGEGNHTLMALRSLRFYVKASIEKRASICVINEALSRELLKCNQYVQKAEDDSSVKVLEQLINLVGDLAFSTLKERLLRCLREYGAEAKNGEIFITHEELANNLGTSREVVSRLLKELAREDDLSLMRKRIVLNDTIWDHDKKLW